MAPRELKKDILVGLGVISVLISGCTPDALEQTPSTTALRSQLTTNLAAVRYTNAPVVGHTAGGAPVRALYGLHTGLHGSADQITVYGVAGHSQEFVEASATIASSPVDLFFNNNNNVAAALYKNGEFLAIHYGSRERRTIDLCNPDGTLLFERIAITDASGDTVYKTGSGPGYCRQVETRQLRPDAFAIQVKGSQSTAIPSDCDPNDSFYKFVLSLLQFAEDAEDSSQKECEKGRPFFCGVAAGYQLLVNAIKSMISQDCPSPSPEPAPSCSPDFRFGLMNRDTRVRSDGVSGCRYSTPPPWPTPAPIYWVPDSLSLVLDGAEKVVSVYFHPNIPGYPLCKGTLCPEMGWHSHSGKSFRNHEVLDIYAQGTTPGSVTMYFQQWINSKQYEGDMEVQIVK